MSIESDHEELERHLNLWFGEWYPTMRDEPLIGCMPEAIVCGLINIAKSIAHEYSDHLPDRYFEACLHDILAGGDGLAQYTQIRE